MLVSVGFAAGSLLASRLPDQLSLGWRAGMGSAFALAAAFAALIVTLGDGWPAGALIGCVLALAFASGITMPASQAGAIGAAPGLAGTASGLSGFLGTLTAAAATQVMGALSDGTPRAVTIAMVMLSAAALAGSVVARRTPS